MRKCFFVYPRKKIPVVRAPRYSDDCRAARGMRKSLGASSGAAAQQRGACFFHVLKYPRPYTVDMCSFAFHVRKIDRRKIYNRI